ncbi:ABC transporter ATP-binding protein [Adhaeribacter aerolatus]|uniref:ABC transporter ATP-binding protein n=1 Tax=Adhaeribacter aerolatus TaxID=670289 RepID=A0A512AT68_9BACT|nr:peptidase domain-containing ABC transporter [Adhaeribacter aerolatus]GEO02905.1 ABC transporter ATP-binding protein [Adhaeribacter aerolatus]
MKQFPFYRQLDAMDCGPTCLRMVAKHYGKIYSLQALRQKSYFTREGVSLLGISDAAEAIGFRTLMAKIPFEKLKAEAPTPFIAHWRQRHFVVVYGFKKDQVLVADPSHGLIQYSRQEFLDGWLYGQPKEAEAGIVLFLETTPAFYAQVGEESTGKLSFSFLLAYLKPYKRFLVQLFVGMLVGSLLQLIFPLLTQSIVDVGINTQNINFVNLVLAGQLMLFFSRTAVEMIRSWILLHIGTRINISILSDFLIKLMKLPLGFFDTKMIGDLLQRIGDHKRIESFLTSSTLSVVFSFVNLLIFGLVLAYYDLKIFGIFLLGSVLYATWVLVFMRRRRDLDYKLFDQMAANQSNLIQLISGMQEIKLQNCERQKRWEWERIQAALFKVSIKTLALNQYQESGSIFINEAKNIFITYMAAKAVINGEITLGMMLAVQSIIGQLNAPINEMINFIRASQDAKISLERLGEIHQKKNEEDDKEQKLVLFPEDGSLTLHHIGFKYEGAHSEKVLRNISLTIPQGKTTAIVGASGSGKTTLIKLLLKFYEPTQGEIRLGGMGFSHFSNRHWRERCGAVMQDGYIFNDTIARNIAIGDDEIDRERLLYAVKVANIQEYIESLALNYNTKIGGDGHGLSQGQRQRILIARAVYKNPDYIFFDEATNALDANNERTIMGNLNSFLDGKTVVVVAHRLSTVVNADQIIVLDKGQIIERGTHTELAGQRGAYFQLVRNQLELGT